MRRRLVFHAIALLGVVAGSIALAPAAQAAPNPPWTITELKALSGDTVTNVWDVNESGVSVGWSGARPVKWDASGNPTVLPYPTAGCTNGSANAISDTGWIVGITQCPGLPNNGTIWLPDGTPVSMGAQISPTDVTKDGIVVGEHYPNGFSPFGGVPFAFIAGKPPLQLSRGGATYAHVSEVTNFGYLVGTLREFPAATGLPKQVAVGWYGNSIFPLLKTPLESFSTDVNGAGVALVTTLAANSSDARSYLVAPGGRISAFAHPGVNDYVIDINDGNIGVGTTQPVVNGTYEGAFYAFGSSVRLDSLVSPADATTYGLDQPRVVNNKAWVAGNRTDATAWILKPPAAA